MKIVIVGATGFVGKALVAEAAHRGHEVTAIARHVDGVASVPGVTARNADVMDTDSLAKVFAGHDAVLSAFNPGWTNPNIYNDSLAGLKSIEKAVEKAGVLRYLVIGGAGSLEVSPGVQLVDTPQFPADYKDGARAARDYLNVLKQNARLEWTFLSPAILMHAGITDGRTGSYRIGTDNPVFDAHGESRLSVEDLAVALIDELEQRRFVRRRFTAAY
ncbi:MAG TPA: NAD(P)-dependent oxidoreductase [Spirochaetia bacterium]|nr:NAD(P)-dependent oxidoreductase [Spirochaetia bacterium]